MSLWDKYLAPGDLRSRQHQTPPALSDNDEQSLKKLQALTHTPRIDPATRHRRQNALLFGGAAFTLLSLLVTRRALHRKQTSAILESAGVPGVPGAGAGGKADGALEAVQALSYASLNVFSFAMLSAGVAITYLDIADLEDMRVQFRRAAGYGEDGEGDQRADEEIEGWIAETLARRDEVGGGRPGRGGGKGGNGGLGGMKESIAEKIRELRENDKKEEERESYTQAELLEASTRRR